MDFSYGISCYSTATGKTILFSPLNGRDVWGFDNGARALPSSIPGQQDRPPRRSSRRMSATRRNRSRRSDVRSTTCGALSSLTARRDRAGAFRPATASASSASSRARRTRTRSSTSKRTASSCASPAARAPTAELEAVSDYAMQIGHAESAARHRRQHRLSVHAESSPRHRELLHAQRPRRRAVLRGRQHRQRASTTRTTACSSSKKA